MMMMMMMMMGCYIWYSEEGPERAAVPSMASAPTSHYSGLYKGLTSESEFQVYFRDFACTVGLK